MNFEQVLARPAHWLPWLGSMPRVACTPQKLANKSPANKSGLDLHDVDQVAVLVELGPV